jgi:hypothetical protein
MNIEVHKCGSLTTLHLHACVVGSLSMYGKYSVHTIPSRVSVDQHAWAEQGQRERDSGPMDRIVMHLFVCWMLPSDGTPRVQEAWTYLVPDLV